MALTGADSRHAAPAARDEACTAGAALQHIASVAGEIGLAAERHRRAYLGTIGGCGQGCAASHWQGKGRLKCLCLIMKAFRFAKMSFDCSSSNNNNKNNNTTTTTQQQQHLWRTHTHKHQLSHLPTAFQRSYFPFTPIR